MTYLLFVIAALLLLGLIYLIWRIWGDYTRISPEDEEYERTIASLNDAQANRVSDQQLARRVDTDASWQIMVRRGLSSPSRRRQRRSSRGPR